MKYLTKEWYNKMQCTSLHIGLTIDKRASVFSEPFYQKLYKKAEKEYIKLNSSFVDYEEYKKLMQEFEFIDWKEEDFKDNFEKVKESYNGMTLEEFFYHSQRSKVQELKEKLPKNIISKIKDCRVFVLGYASKEVYSLVKNFCEDNHKFVEDRFSEYNKLEEETFKNDSLEFCKESFHDAYIKTVDMNNDDIEIILDNEGAFTDKTSVLFKNANIVLAENIEGTYWIYNEIYKVKGGYEVHLLTRYGDLKEFIVRCEDIILS